MANDNRNKHDRRNDNSNSSKYNRRHCIPNPPVPHAQASLLQAPVQRAVEPPAPDPETMDAKKGLNEWGAFGGAGSNGANFGFGPLLFHSREEVESETLADVQTQTPAATSSRDTFEMDSLLLNDPISFNPLQAISWAKLDEEPIEVVDNNTRKSPGSPASADARSFGAAGNESSLGYSTGSVKGRRKRKNQEGHRVHHVDASPSTAGTSTRNGSMAWSVPDTPKSRAPLSTGSTVSRSLSTSDGTLVTPKPDTDGRSITTSPTYPLPTAQHRPSTRKGRQSHQRRGQTKQAAQSPVTAQFGPPSQNLYHLPSPPQPPPFAQPAPMMATQPYPYSYPSSSQPPPHHDHLLVCLGPQCNAQFRTEPELNAHYRAEHSFACNWTNCGASGFTSNNALVWHVKAEHLLLCPVPGCCDRVFPNKKALDGHVRVN